MTHTAHIVAFYWSQWRKSGGGHDFAKGSGFWHITGGNVDWFSKYYRECEASAAPGSTL